MNLISNSNQLQSFLTQLDAAAAPTNSNDTDKDNNSRNNEISLNFIKVTQFILQYYFKVDINDLASLKLIDLIVDQTYPDSLTLRKLNESSDNPSSNNRGTNNNNQRGKFQSYEYFNTVSRDPDVTRCPIFIIAIYFLLKWGHPNSLFSLQDFESVNLIDPNLISYNLPTDLMDSISMNMTNSTSKILRSTFFEPSKHLTDLVFPWLPIFRENVLMIDRTNYKLHSLCELFEFMAKIIIQDLKYLNQHALLLPNIVNYLANYVPNVFRSDEFKNMDEGNRSEIVNTSLHNNNTLNSRTIPPSLTTTNTGGMLTQQHHPAVDIQFMESNFLNLSKKLTTENIRLSQQINQLKGDLNSLSSMCTQILQVQRQLLSGSVAISQQQALQVGQQGSSPYFQSNHNSPQVLETHTPALAPINIFPTTNKSDNNSTNNSKKRKLPIPSHTSVASPFTPSPGITDSPYGTVNNNTSNIGSDMTKRTRLEDKPTPSQTALDSLLTRSVGSPKILIPTNFSQQPSSSRVPNDIASPSQLISDSFGNGKYLFNQPPARPSSSLSQSATTASTKNPNVQPMSFPTSKNTNGEVEAKKKQSVEQNTSTASANGKDIVQKLPTLTLISRKNNNYTTSNEKRVNNPPVKTGGPNENIKYKLSRENKTIWDLYAEWYIGINGKWSIKKLIEEYGWRRWKVSEDSHFFPTRRVIMDYIETECDRGITLGRFTSNQSREDVRKILVSDLEKFRINNGLTLNSLSLYFRNLIKNNEKICIFKDANSWNIRIMTDDERNKYCKRQNVPASGSGSTSLSTSMPANSITNIARPLTTSSPSSTTAPQSSVTGNTRPANYPGKETEIKALVINEGKLPASETQQNDAKSEKNISTSSPKISPMLPSTDPTDSNLNSIPKSSESLISHDKPSINTTEKKSEASPATIITTTNTENMT